MTAVSRVDFRLQMATVIGEIRSETERDIAPSQPEMWEERGLRDLCRHNRHSCKHGHYSDANAHSNGGCLLHICQRGWQNFTQPRCRNVCDLRVRLPGQPNRIIMFALVRCQSEAMSGVIFQSKLGVWVGSPVWVASFGPRDAHIVPFDVPYFSEKVLKGCMYRKSGFILALATFQVTLRLGKRFTKTHLNQPRNQSIKPTRWKLERSCSLMI